MLTCAFADTHKLDHKVDDTSPELRFVRHICEGGTDVASFFAARQLSGREVVLDAPNGRFVGLDGISAFAQSWLSRPGATSAQVVPVIETIANGRAVSEVEVRFELESGKTLKVPMAVFADLAPQGKMEGMRIYYFYHWIPGTPAYRKPIFRPTHMTWCEPRMMTGVVRYYYEQLHNAYTDEAYRRIMEMASDGVRYGGYRTCEAEPPSVGKHNDYSKHYVNITKGIPRHQYIRFETITDDGLNCLVEWTSIVRMSGLRQGIVSQAGMAAYERDIDGKLLSVRICDNLGYEDEIDRDSIDPDDMFVA